MANRTLLIAVLAWSALGAACGVDDALEPEAATPETPAWSVEAGAHVIVVGSSAELVAALSPVNAGRRILVRAGTYPIEAPLTVPDGTALEGEGVMRFEGGLPVGFDPDMRTTLRMDANVPGNVLTLGDGASIRGLKIVDLPGRTGNVVAVVSRDAGDRISATIAESEIVNPNPLVAGTGYGLLVVTDNPNLGASPAPHEGAALSVRMVRSLIRSPAEGGGLFVFNFAALGSVSVKLAGNVIGGEITANGGVSRPDAVHDSEVAIESHRNLYRNDSPSPCAMARSFAWNLTGGSGPPVPLPVPETARNTLRMHSVDDRIEGFRTGVLAFGGRRFFGLPTAGPSTDNGIDLELLGGRISTPSCGGAAFVADLDLAGAFAGSDALIPGDGNTLRAVIRGVTGSGSRSNEYANSQGPSGALPTGLQGDNHLAVVGSLEAFARTNRHIDPLPGTEFFTGTPPR